jgi:ribosome assembly protein 4 (RSA4)
MGVMVAQVKPPERERLLERRDGRERLFERMHGGRSPNTLFRFPTSSFTSRSRQFSEELVWFKPLLDPGEVVFSPDGQFLASPKRGGGIGIFRVSDGTLVRTLTGHTDSVYSVTFSPDGNLIASGSRDETINIWQVSDVSLVRTLTGHTGEVRSVTFSPDGSLIASGGGDGLALWRVGAPTNRPPSIPTLLSPDDGSTVSPTPTFKVKSEDPDGDDVKFVLELRKGDEVKNFETGFFASGSEATFTVPSDQALSEGQWSWRARAIDSKGAVSDWSGTRTIQVILVPLIKSGVRLVSCPVIGSN